MADDNIFVYMGGDQEVPEDVTRVRIDKSVKIIPAQAFRDRAQLAEVEGHDEISKIEQNAFLRCWSLRRVKKMKGVREIEEYAFWGCYLMTDLDLEFGEKLEVIGHRAFYTCKSLKHLKMPSVRRVGMCAFEGCKEITDAEFGDELEIIDGYVFHTCTSLRSIAIPLKDGMIGNDAFINCVHLSRVDIIGRVHKTISSLHMESWRKEVNEEIERINQTLPNTNAWRRKTAAIQQWIRSVISRLEHYKAEHRVLLKEAMVLLELALWKAKLLDGEEGKCNNNHGEKSRKVNKDNETTRQEHRVTCGADTVIKNVLPFLSLE